MTLSLPSEGSSDWDTTLNNALLGLDSRAATLEAANLVSRMAAVEVNAGTLSFQPRLTSVEALAAAALPTSAAVDTATYGGTSVAKVNPTVPASANRQTFDVLAPRRFGALVPDVGRRIGRANLGTEVQSGAALHVATKRNLWRYSETLSDASYSVTSATKQTDTVVVDGITLTRVSMGNFYSALTTNMSGLGLTPFTIGTRYLMSYYAMIREGERFVWMQNPAVNGTSYGHRSRLLTNRPRRIWTMMQAVSTANFSLDTDPTTAWGAGTAVAPNWLNRNDTAVDTSEIYVGGFQLEAVGTTYVDGIALVGDSTMAGSANQVDLIASREVSRYVEGLLNVSVFNRAVGGRKLSDIDAAWATDVTPIKHRCKYVIVQGGVNDFGQSVALATVQASVASIAAKAATDGLIPVFLTCSPSVGITDVPADEVNRLAFNAWLKVTYPRVIDIAAVLEDPYAPGYLRRDPLWWGDGTHYVANAKRAVGAAIAEWPGWDFLSPSPYQPIAGASFDPAPSALYLADQSNGNRYKITVVAGVVTATIA